jgi:hypothetical protein
MLIQNLPDLYAQTFQNKLSKLNKIDAIVYYINIMDSGINGMQ